ncbi:MAG: CNP1-like family protein [Rhodocyclaceae bacterium]|nr:CNP1-like family protein [Rhodocyclaceae bacterium]
MCAKRLLGLAGTFCLLSGVGLAQAQFGLRQDDPDAPPWQEEVVEPPAYPEEANLLPFYVSEMTAHRFFIDGTSLSVGKDGVVRYVLVVRTAGGTTNVSFEGIRCETREFRIYATGRGDRSWAKARLSEWRPIENKPMNRHHAALSRDLFCPGGVPIASPAEGRNALKLGKHPHAT